MPAPVDIARRRLAGASDKRQRAVAELALALLSIPATSPLSPVTLSGVGGGGGEAGGSDCPAHCSPPLTALPVAWPAG